jgi:ABC-2 type transport system ATP-binding protein
MDALVIEGLRKTYKKTVALDGLSFAVPAGRVTGFLGPNGAGKTTTFRSLLGLTRPDAGTMEILGMKVEHDMARIVKRLGAIVEEPGLIKGLNGRDNLKVAALTLGRRSVEVCRARRRRWTPDRRVLERYAPAAGAGGSPARRSRVAVSG